MVIPRDARQVVGNGGLGGMRDMRAEKKVLVSLLAAEDAGHSDKLTYPIVHTYIYYLGKRGVDFSEYIFNVYDYADPTSGEEPAEYLCSAELSEDLAALLGRGLVYEKPGSILLGTSPAAQERREIYIDEFNRLGEIDYEQLKAAAENALRNPRHLLEEAYREYIRELVSA